MEHRTILGGGHFLPFARKRIVALKKLGLSYASQSFTVEGVSIDVRIEPGHEFIRLQAIPSGLGYLLWPTSIAYPTGVTEEVVDGETIAVQPRAEAGAGGSVRLHTELQSAPHDWLSYDGDKANGEPKYGAHLLTFDTGSFARYQWLNPPSSGFSGYQFIFVDGVYTVTVGGVRGAGMITIVTEDEGISVSTLKTIYATYSTSDLRSIALRTFTGSGTGKYAEEVVASYTLPAGLLRLTHPIFFGGDGRKFVTVAQTYSAGGYLNPTFVVTGVISSDPAGVLTLDVTLRQITELGEVSEGPGAVLTPYVENLNQLIGGTALSGYYNTDVVSLIGVDIDAKGRELVITRTQSTRRTWSGAYSRAYSNDGGLNVSETRNHNTSDSTNTSISIRINGSPLLSATAVEDTNGSEAYSSSIVGGVSLGGSWDESSRTAGENLYVAIHDIDARYAAIAYTITRRFAETTTTRSGFYAPSITTSTFGNWNTQLGFSFWKVARSKPVLSFPTGTPPPGYGLNSIYTYRMMASRRHDEAIVCVSWLDAVKGDALPPIAGVDREALAYGISKNGAIPLKPKKLGLGADAVNANYAPVHLLFLTDTDTTTP